MKSKWDLAGIIIGAVSVLVGLVFVIYPGYTGGGTSHTFGGDFYTYMYAIVNSAFARLGDIIGILGRCFGFLFIFSGALEIIIFGRRYTEAKPGENVANALSEWEDTEFVNVHEATNEMKACSSCGAWIPAEADYCSECGAPQ